MIRRLLPVLVAVALVPAAGCSREGDSGPEAAAEPAFSGPPEYVTGMTRLTQGNLFGAAFHFEKAALLYPDSLDYSFTYADICRRLGSQDKDYFARAEQVYDELEAVVGESDVRLRLARARLLMAQMKVDDAVAILKTLVDDYPDDCHYWILLGKAQIHRSVVLRGAAGPEAQMNELTVADQTYSKAIQLCPDSLSSYEGRAAYLELSRDYENLIKLYEDLMERFPDDPEPLRRCAYAHFMARDWGGAAEQFERLLDWDYTVEDNGSYIACLDKLGRKKEQEEWTKTFLEHKPRPEGPRYLTPYQLLARELDTQPVTDKAADLFEKEKYQEAIDLWKQVRAKAEARLDDEKWGQGARDYIVWLDMRIHLAESRLSGEPVDAPR